MDAKQEDEVQETDRQSEGSEVCTKLVYNRANKEQLDTQRRF